MNEHRKPQRVVGQEVYEKTEQADRIQSLFAAVVHQAIVDAHTSPKAISRIRPPRRQGEPFREYKERIRDIFSIRRVAARRERDEARAWLTQNSEDFRFVVSAAGLDPDYIRDGALKLEERGWPEIKKGAYGN